MKKNIDKIRTEMLAAGIDPAKVEIYIESLAATTTVMAVERTLAVRPTPTVTNGPWVVMSDGTIGHPDDGDPVEHWTR